MQVRDSLAYVVPAKYKMSPEGEVHLVINFALVERPMLPEPVQRRLQRHNGAAEVVQGVNHGDVLLRDALGHQAAIHAEPDFAIHEDGSIVEDYVGVVLLLLAARRQVPHIARNESGQEGHGPAALARCFPAEQPILKDTFKIVQARSVA